MKYLIILLMLLPSFVLADNVPPLELGYGVMRENTSLTDYHVLVLGWRFNQYFTAVGGTLLGKAKSNWEISGHYVTGPDLQDNFVGGQLQLWEQYLVGGIGIIRLSRTTPDLTSPYQFFLRFGVHYNGYSLNYEHISNGHLIGGGGNAGEDLLVASFNF